MALIGYARVSSIGQSLESQLNRLQHCEKIYQEKETGTSNQRPQLTACIDYVRDGDVLVVTRLDRLARSTLHLCQLAEALEKKSVQLHVLDQAINTEDATGRLLFNMLGAIAQFETEIRAERQRDGIEAAKARGVSFGKKKKLSQSDQDELRRRRREGALIRELSVDFKLGKSSVYRYLEEPSQEICDVK